MNGLLMGLSNPLDRILRGGGKVQVNADGSITLTPAAGTNVTLASGQLLLPDGSASAPSPAYTGATNTGFYRSGSQLYAVVAGSEGFRTDGGNLVIGGPVYVGASGASLQATLDVILIRDAAGILAQRNGTNAQIFRAYSTYTDASNYTRLVLDTSGGTVGLFAENAGTGPAHIMKIGTRYGNNLHFTVNNVDRTILTSALFGANTDGGLDLGASGANRFANAYLTGVAAISGGASANGQAMTLRALTELLTVAAAATSDTTIQIPANAVVFAVSVRTTTVIPTAATYTVTGAASGTAFNTAAVGTAANSTDVGTAATPYKNGAAQAIRITPNLTPADNTGRVRVTIHYYDISPPTS